MSTHQQPREMAELKGATKVNPERYRTTIPKSKMPLGDYPETRSTNPAECWKELAALAIPGVLTGSDRIMMEVLADLLAQYRENPGKFPAPKMTHLVGIMARFGMSASDRNKLGVTKPDPGANHWAALSVIPGKLVNE